MDDEKALAKVIVVVSVLTILAFAGVFIWGIIELVSWLVTK